MCIKVMRAVSLWEPWAVFNPVPRFPFLSHGCQGAAVKTKPHVPGSERDWARPGGRWRLGEDGAFPSSRLGS